MEPDCSDEEMNSKEKEVSDVLLRISEFNVSEVGITIDNVTQYDECSNMRESLDNLMSEIFASETKGKFIWPIVQTKRPCYPPPNRLSVEGSLQSPPIKPRLRYHKQSNYTDVFTKQPLTTVRAPEIESRWIDPIGKYGEFLGESIYERTFKWPTKIKKPEEHKKPILQSSIGMGIIPLLGSRDGKELKEESTKEEQLETIKVKVQDNSIAAQR
ncbi:uncharacterized protein NPIL_81901 [Nephila pilipes]|uniref:Uncharacterized protein n=1 Tax=Nephila pilipes TaxID=299642 RepID=A0A8X6TIE9_NEPPI|nr:uncharacterized protein NPIL_81901 [Nephila pilipes]